MDDRNYDLEPEEATTHTTHHTAHHQHTHARKHYSSFREQLGALGLNWRKIVGIGVLVGLLFLVLTPIITYLLFIRDLGSKESIINHNNAGVILLDRNDEEFFSLYQATTKHSITLDTIPETTQQAVIAIEDKDFYKHPGFSIEGIGRAFVENVKHEGITQGGSTLTQQLVKNALLSQEKSFLRKYQEIVLALEVERRYSKDDILEMYLNTVYFGEGAFGIQDAATAYFGKDVSQLTLAESAMLAGILPAPSAYSPISGNKTAAYSRMNLVLNQMQIQGYITEAQKQQALSEKITFNPQSSDLNTTAAHFALMVKNELIKKYGEQALARSGFTVKTTLDLEGQKYAQTTVENQVARLSGSKVSNSAAVVMDVKTGEILALVGSHDWDDENNGKINMAITPRQPGSSFKPLVYTKALEDHIITPATMLDDKPVEYPGGYKPKNYDGKFRGQVTARYALANSLNIPALHVEEKVGIPSTISFAESLGITSLKDSSNYGLSIVLGAAEVPLVEMTNAFATFGNAGEKVSHTTILEIKNKKGNTIYTYAPDRDQVVSESAAYIISNILSDNKARADTFGSTLSISRPAAVKTGTTEDYRDGLTIGYTPQIAVGVWVGNNDNTPMTSVAGSLGAAPIWRSLMEYFLKGLQVEKFYEPSSVNRKQVCQTFGDGDSASRSAFFEYFMPGTGPTKDCNLPTPTSNTTPTPDETGTPTPSEKPTETPQPTSAPTSEPTKEPASTPIQIIVPTGQNPNPTP